MHCTSPNIIRNLTSRRLRWRGHVAGMEQSRNAHIILVEKPEGKRPLGRAQTNLAKLLLAKALLLKRAFFF